MNNQVFRKKSMERVSSPEQLNDYVRVSNPGICIQGILEHLDTKVETVSVCKDGKMFCYFSDSDIETVKTGMKIMVNDTEYKITEISSAPFCMSDDMGSCAMHL